MADGFIGWRLSWLEPMEDLAGTAVRVTPERHQADEWAVVLAAGNIPHRLHPGLDGWALIVAARDAEAAREALDAYDRENIADTADVGADAVAPVRGAAVAGTAPPAPAPAPRHDSVGASTAMFGAIGILAATRVVSRGRHPAARKLWMVGAASLALLALLGTSPGSDLLAHLFGLLLGGALGLAAAPALRRPLRPPVQWALAVAVLAAVVGAWLRAFS